MSAPQAYRGFRTQRF